ncbi:hypothetical protein COV15_00780 [Candidatus Woesearchaeota archaeon CG10_big_fil_rev_8_21_14_0_10_34_12]|nr:MAG: hypothetical protein COV15_00780 [Candidatus Woesearchaeota archaeon CG10_big_fil_rev_8_21_14_0_10_34_12]
MQPNYQLCLKCMGKGLCGKSCSILSKFKQINKTHFSGSPAEVFIGRAGYPNINAGLLSSEEHDNTEKYSMPEIWHKENLQLDKILEYRSRLIYPRFKARIKGNNSFKSKMQEIALAKKPVSTEFFLKKAPINKITLDICHALIGNPAPLKSMRIEENPKVERRMDYLSSDYDAKAKTALKELYQNKIETSSIIKVLSAGLLGLKIQRKLVPTRWAITAVDDTLSKFLLEKIRFFPEISGIHVFHSYYLGNHYEFILLPDKFSFEVIEAKISGSVWNKTNNLSLMQDYEGFNGRKDYANEVTGAYYSNRLALCEYLTKIKRQASCLVLRECRPEYYAPCGVGILRETSRTAFQHYPEKFETLHQAIQSSQQRLKLPVAVFKEKSVLLKEFAKQKRLNNFF